MKIRYRFSITLVALLIGVVACRASQRGCAADDSDNETTVATLGVAESPRYAVSCGRCRKPLMSEAERYYCDWCKQAIYCDEVCKAAAWNWHRIDCVRFCPGCSQQVASRFRTAHSFCDTCLNLRCSTAHDLCLKQDIK